MSIKQNGKVIAGSFGTRPQSQPLLSFIWSDHLLNDISWLRADTFSWQNGTIYEGAYSKLVEEYADGTEETENGVTYKRTTSGFKICAPDQETNVVSAYNDYEIAWYYILDTDNKRFKLPRTKYGFTGLRDNAGGYIDESLPNITGSIGADTSNAKGSGSFSVTTGSALKGIAGAENTHTTYLTLDASDSSSVYKDSAHVQQRATQMYLYFFMGDSEYSESSSSTDTSVQKALENKVDLDLNNTTVFSTSENVVSLKTSTPSDSVGKEVVSADYVLSKAGGLPIGSVITMPFGVDESENKFRYLNGQTIVQSQFSAFTTKVKSWQSTRTNLFTTETNWQAEKTASVLGQCGKFVIDDDAGTIRLPCVVNINGLTDLANCGVVKSESLPNITGNIGVIGGTISGNSCGGGFANSSFSSGSQSGLGGGLSNSHLIGVTFNASRSSSTYQNNAPVQQEAVQYPYVICVNTGVEEADRPINNYQVNNVYSYGMSQYYKGTMNNNSWLKSNGQWNSGTVYTDVYNWALEQANNGVDGFKGKGYNWVTADNTATYWTSTENIKVGVTVYGYPPNMRAVGCVESVTENGFSFTDSVNGNTITVIRGDSSVDPTVFSGDWLTDYDWVINTADQTFRLPLLNGEENLPDWENPVDISSPYPDSSNIYTAPSDGYVSFYSVSGQPSQTMFVYINGVNTQLGFNTTSQYMDNSALVIKVKRYDLIYLDKKLTSGTNYFYFRGMKGNGSLYFYIGDTLQNASLIDIAKLSEQIIDIKSRRYVTEAWHEGTSWYRIWSDGWIEQGGIQQGNAAYGITTVSLLKPYKDTTYFISSSIAALDTQWFTFTTTAQGQAITDICGSPCNITVQSFDLQSFSTHNWYACGY